MTLTGLDQLPPEIADVLLRYRDEAYRDGRHNPNFTYSDTVTDLEREVCTAFATALNESREDSRLRERAERLRRQVIWEWRDAGIRQDELVRRSTILQPGDLADNLKPDQGGRMSEPPVIYLCPRCQRPLNRLPFADYPVFLCPVCNAGWRYEDGWIQVGIRLDEQDQVIGTIDLLH